MRHGVLRDAAFLLAAALVMGTVANLIPGRQLPWWGQGSQPPQAGVDFVLIDPAAADALRTALPNVVFLDTRPAQEIAAERIPGAVALSLSDVNEQLTPALESRLRAADAVIIYGASDETDVEQLLAQQLRQRGLPPPNVLAGGLPAWQASGLTLEGTAS